MVEDEPFYVAKFKAHPLGGERYVRDFVHWPRGNSGWWDKASVEQRKENIAFFLQHERYHFSTDDLQKADMIWERDKAWIAEYLDVEFIGASLSVVPAGEHS